MTFRSYRHTMGSIPSCVNGAHVRSSSVDTLDTVLVRTVCGMGKPCPCRNGILMCYCGVSLVWCAFATLTGMDGWTCFGEPPGNLVIKTSEMTHNIALDCAKFSAQLTHTLYVTQRACCKLVANYNQFANMYVVSPLQFATFVLHIRCKSIANVAAFATVLLQITSWNIWITDESLTVAHVWAIIRR